MKIVGIIMLSIDIVVVKRMIWSRCSWRIEAVCYKVLLLKRRNETSLSRLLMMEHEARGGGLT